MLSVCLMLLETEEDRKKFSEVYEREHKGLLKYAMSKLNNIEDAEDAVSEAFIRFAENYHKYSLISCSDFHKFLVIILRNIIINLYNKVDRSFTVDYESEEKIFLAESLKRYEEYGGPEKYSIDKETMGEMLKILNRLSPVLRDTFLCKHYVGLDIDKIAKIYGVSYKTIESRLYRATVEIRKAVKADEDE